MDYEAEYDTRARVPEHLAIIEGWLNDSAAYRQAASCELDVRYGEAPRMTYDLFRPAGPADAAAALVMFIHGGYWYSRTPKDFSHLAAGLNKRGLVAAMPGYTLCPDTTVAGIVEELRQAAAELWRRFGRRIVVTGHSAGGHLTATTVATDWTAVERGLPGDLARRGLAISGLFDLAPMLDTSLNQHLRLDAEAARAASPVEWEPPAGVSLQAAVGGAESSEFLRQSRALVAAWGRNGAEMRFRAVDGANHFTVIAELTDPGSRMVDDLVAMAGAG